MMLMIVMVVMMIIMMIMVIIDINIIRVMIMRGACIDMRTKNYCAIN